jgi:HK97 family phage portal protein
MLARLLRRVRDRARPDDTKASRTGPLVAWPAMGRPVWTPRDYGALAREGFQRNAVVHRAVRMVAEAAASVTLNAFTGEREVPDHPILALLARPNGREGGAAFLEAVYGHLLVAGNAYVEAVSVDGVPRELHALRPDRMRVIPGPDGWAQGWDYTVGGRTVRFDAPEDGGVPPILHLTLFNPLDDHYGLSPMEAAATALDIHNAAGAWNKALLDNSARPSGALVVTTPQGIPLGDEQVQRLREELESGFQGPGRAGRPLLLEGGIDWKPLSLSPKDMDFVQAKAAAAREIALAFGVPPMLLGLPGDNTFANYAEANRGFWRQTVLPLVGRTAQSLAHWLEPAWEGGREAPSSGAARHLLPRGEKGDGPLRLVPDLDRVDALAGERRELWSRVGAAGFLSEDEKRAAVGYGPRGGEGKGGWAGLDPVPGDRVATPRGVGTSLYGGPSWSFGLGGDGHWVNQPRVPAGSPDGGQWTAGGGGSAYRAELRLPDLPEPFAKRPASGRVEVAVDITGFTKHGVNQAINRGVSPKAILDAVQNPLKIVPRPDGSVQYRGRGATVVLNPGGAVITVWPK